MQGILGVPERNRAQIALGWADSLGGLHRALGLWSLSETEGGEGFWPLSETEGGEESEHPSELQLSVSLGSSTSQGGVPPCVV